MNCSTPYGITARGILRLGFEVEAVELLNALRHHGPGHPISFVYTSPDGVCSTPYGITARGIGSDRMPGNGDSFCSTPYGITAWGIKPEEADDPGALVLLNALRHHGPGHAHTASRRATSSTAQRLTASRPGAFPPSLATSSFTSASAQHLTASRPGASVRVRVGAVAALLLNALRHHGPGHERGADRRLRSDVLLNALRHHGPGHGGDPVRYGCLVTCSTPYGITARGIARGRRANRR